MQALLKLLLVVVLLACPAMCRSTEVDCCAGHAAEDCSQEPGQGGSDTPAPDDAASCLCSGMAMKADDSHASHGLSVLPALPPVTFATGPRLVRGDLPSQGLAADPDGWSPPVRLHALLVVYRC